MQVKIWSTSLLLLISSKWKRWANFQWPLLSSIWYWQVEIWTSWASIQFICFYWWLLSHPGSWDPLTSSPASQWWNVFQLGVGGTSWQSSGWDFTFQCRHVGWIPGWGTKIPHASWPKIQTIKQWQCYHKFSKDFKNGLYILKKKKKFLVHQHLHAPLVCFLSVCRGCPWLSPWTSPQSGCRARAGSLVAGRPFPLLCSPLSSPESLHSALSRLHYWPQGFLPLLIFMLVASDSGILFTKAGCTPPLPPIPNLRALFDFELSHVTCFGQYNEASIMMCYFQAWAFINPLFPCLAFFASAITKITFLSFCSDARKMRDIYSRTTTDKPSISKSTLSWLTDLRAYKLTVMCHQNFVLVTQQ